jgi:hypothetical protein
MYFGSPCPLEERSYRPNEHKFRQFDRPDMIFSFLGVLLVTVIVFFGVYAIARATLGQ